MDLLEVRDRFLLVEVLSLLLQHFAVADNRVQRRPELVAHVRQELALGAVGGFGRILGLEQLFLRALSCGDVVEDGDAVVEHAFLVLERRRVDTQPPTRCAPVSG